jgi:hypothetical protein
VLQSITVLAMIVIAAALMWLSSSYLRVGMSIFIGLSDSKQALDHAIGSKKSPAFLQGFE